MKFLKFEFTDEAEWLTIKESLYVGEEETLIPEITAIHEIGFICLAKDEEGECIDLSTKYAVDMICEDLEILTPFVVWPKPCGVHIFAGWEAAYKAEFCAINPDSPYCVIPEVNDVVGS